MKKIARQSVTLALAAAAIGVLACNSKITECNKLIEKANAAMTTVNNAEKQTDGKDAPDVSNQLDTAKTDIQGVQLSDATLKGFQTQYVSTLDRMSTAEKAYQAAQNKTDPVAAASAFKDLSAAADDNGKLVDNINKYCSGS